jgi:hypothetical protein
MADPKSVPVTPKPVPASVPPAALPPFGPADTVTRTPAVLDTPARTTDVKRKEGEEEEEEEKEKFPLLKKASPLRKGESAAVVSEHSRAPEGYQRFRIRAMNYQGYTHLYILAARDDLAAAKKCYLEASGLQKYLDDLGEVVDPREVKRPQLNVLPLPD